MKNHKLIAVIGLGNISAVHVEALKDPRYKIEYLCDIDESKFSKYSDIKSAKFVKDYKEITNVDCVHVCIDHQSHYEVVKYFISKNIDVFCEKVLTTSFGKSSQLVTLAEKNNVRLGVCFQNRYNPNINIIKTMLKENTMGALNSIFCEIVWNREDSYYIDNWQSKLQYAGGGVLTTQASHTIDLLIQLFGEYYITESKLLYRDGLEVETTAHLKLKFGNVDSLIYATVDSPIDNEVRIVLSFKEGSLILDGNNLYQKKNGYIYNNTYIGEENSNGKSSWGGYHKIAIDEFHSGSDTLSAKSAMLTDKFLDEVYKY